MKEFNYFKSIKIWLISIFSFDVLMFAYLFVSGRVFEVDPFFPDLVTTFAGIVLLFSVVAGIASMIYAVVKKEYVYVLHGLGILFGSLILYFAILIIALATIF